MKKYIKPEVEITIINTQPLLSNSVSSLSGLEGVNTGGEFSGGSGDSRRGRWDEEDEWDDEDW